MENRENELSLLKKSKKGLKSLVFSRTGMVVFLLLLQLWIIIAGFIHFRDYSPYFYSLNIMISSVISAVIINNSDIDPVSKITWLVVIITLPLFGALLFMYTKRDVGFRALKFQFSKVMKSTDNLLTQSEEVAGKLKTESPDTAQLAYYLDRSGCYPVYENTEIKYFPSGEEKFRQLLTELEKAEKFIFLEYFIISEGHMWGRILDILSRKAREGVEIMVMYDGSNEFMTLPRDYSKRLRKLGIKCKVFAPATPFVSTHYNYRDHRKILVIDNKVAFTGGINLADEYINRYEKYGHWKDSAIMLKGDAVKSFTLMFLQMWNLTPPNVKYTNYLEYDSGHFSSDGYVIPYGDSPLDKDKVGKQVYLDILSRANKYVYIMSPYLILDGELDNALKFAAERGIDVRLILPGIPDKKTPYALAKTHYSSLLAAGVKIYEYTPGFVHSKVFISDDIKAVVGTINLDYRSLYHHFECAAYIYKSGCISDIKADFENTLEKCTPVTKETVKKEKFSTKLVGFVTKVFAPLM